MSNYINYIVTSEEAGVEKPHPYIFINALTKINAKAEEAIMIGDDLKKDVKGAKNMHIACIHFTTATAHNLY